MRLPCWLRTAERLHLARLLRSARYDTRYLPATERASDDDGLRMLAVAVHAKRYDFGLRRMPPDRSVLIEDLPFNAMLAAANQSLETIAPRARRNRRPVAACAASDAPKPRSRRCGTNRSGSVLLAGRGDRRSRSRSPTVATFLPLWSGAPSRPRADRARSGGCSRPPSGTGPTVPVPSVPVDAPEFQESRYWKGPTWVNTNWMIIEGLRRYGYDDLAR